MTHSLDARGLKCPLPVLKARKALKSVAAGETLTILVTDPGAPEDFRHFCATAGAVLVAIEEAEDHRRIVLRQPG